MLLKRLFSSVFILMMLMGILFVGSGAAEGLTVPLLSTDKYDYSPGEVVHITGTGFAPGASYDLPVMRPDGSIVLIDPVTHQILPGPGYATVDADGLGGLVYDYQLDGIFGAYEVKAYDHPWSGDWGEAPVASVIFTDKPDANLDQCANGGIGDPPEQCIGAAWQNGNLGQSQAHYFEGDFVPYRARIGGATIGEVFTLLIEWDTTQSSKHAEDYIATYNLTETDADPCTGYGTACGDVMTYTIPLDPLVTAGPDGTPGNSDDIVQLPGVFTIFGGAITGLSAYMPLGTFAGTATQSIEVTFTSNVNGVVVLAWSGHISTRLDWGADNSAIAISGSPYHMRLNDFTCSSVTNCGVGQQDRSLSAEAVIYPGSITIIKNASPNSSLSFPFTASPAPLSNFSLIDDGSPTNTIVFSEITNFTSYLVTETDSPSPYQLTQISCTTTSPNGGTVNIAMPSATINLAEGENVTCTFTNGIPTAVTFAGIEALSEDGRVVLNWETAQELDLIGFNIYRSETEAGTKTLLNTGLIEAQAVGGVSGASYQFIDTNVQRGQTYYYWIQLEETTGTSFIESPTVATVYYYVRLPLVIR